MLEYSQVSTEAENIDQGVDADVQAQGFRQGCSDRGSPGHDIPLHMQLQSEQWHPSYIWRKGTVHEYLGKC